jgi:general secretion pathway protein H
MSAPGSEAAPRRAAARRRGGSAGFTLIELLVVVALIAVAAAAVTLTLRDPSETRLEREAARLAALLEAARAEARSTGLAVRWVPALPGGDAEVAGFRFVGLSPRQALPDRWLGEGVSAAVLADGRPAPGAVLGPEPVIGAQRIVLRLESQTLTLATDGLGPFAVQRDEEVPADGPR